MKIRPMQLVGPAIALVLFSWALRVLYRELGSIDYHQVAQEFSRLPWRHVAAAGFFTLGSYLMLTLYDVLALRYVSFSLPYYKIALASFVGYTLSHNLGFPVFTGGAARYRLFSVWGLSTAQIAQAIAFSGILFWVGFLALGGIVFITDPPYLPEGYGVSASGLRPLGILCLLLVALYFFYFGYKKEPLRIKGIEFPNPPVRLSIVGLVVAAIDWVLAANVAYMLLPNTRLNYVEFLGLFQLGQVVGMLSHVPGGVGIFEATILMFMSGQASPSSVAGALLAYRVVYYLVPLACSCSLLLSHELSVNGQRMLRIAERLLERVASFFPQIMTVAMFAGGIILLFSGATPPTPERFALIGGSLPLWIIETSHLMGSLAGIALILLARGVHRRLAAAYSLSAALLILGIAASLLKGFDYEEAVVLLVMFGLLVVSRGHFKRKGSMLAHAFEPNWLTSVVLVLIAAAWLALFAYKHIEYDHGLWQEFSLSGHASRSLRATVGAWLVVFLWGGLRLLSPARLEWRTAAPSEINAAKQVIAAQPHAYAALALLGDKMFLFNDEKSAFIMYGVEGRSCIALGDPVGPSAAMPELIWRFRELCERYDTFCVFYQVRQQNLPFYLDAGLTLLKLGQEALVPLPKFSLEGKSKGAFRSTLSRFERENYQMAVVRKEEVPELLPQLKAVSDAWLAHKNVRERRFSLGFFAPEHLAGSPLAIVRRDGVISAFAGLWCSAGKEELAADFVRYSPQGPSGIMDFLLVELMLWGKEQGYKAFNLGLAPLSGLERHELAPLWNKLGNLLFVHGEHFVNFQGVLHYKEKFLPQWEPKYLASPGGMKLPRICANLANLISGAA